MRYIDYILSGVTSVCFSLYFFLNTPRELTHELTTLLDTSIPLVPAFIIPYISILILIPLTTLVLFMHKCRFGFRSFLLSSIIILLSSNLIFLIWPVKWVLRPEVLPNDFFSYCVGWWYSIDDVYACFPSIHANISMLCALSWHQLQSAYSPFVIFWAWLIVISTVLVKQHYVIDMVIGVVMAVVLYRLATALTRTYLMVEDNKVVKAHSKVEAV